MATDTTTIHLGLSPRAAEFLKVACQDQIEAVGDEDGIYAAIIEDIDLQAKTHRQDRQDRASKAKRKARNK